MVLNGGTRTSTPGDPLPALLPADLLRSLADSLEGVGLKLSVTVDRLWTLSQAEELREFAGRV
jgi:hypothetical protein